MNPITIRTDDGRRALMFKGRTLPKRPTSYKFYKIVGHDLGNLFNPHTLTLYKNLQGILKYEIYRDGSFHPYYGTFKYQDK